MRETDRFSDRHMTAQVVPVYDGRKWPVVRCDSVGINPSDTAHKVTQAVLLTPSVHEKKRRASKYTLAVGTTHGHVQVFLKDSDLVLEAYQRCPADEKCLMLIKKPKDAPKKLLKTQSLNNLSMSDTQLYRQYDRTALNNPYLVHKIKGKTESHSGKEHIDTDTSNNQPQVRKAASTVTSRYSKKHQAPRLNTFVPIPELGIYTPDQHVLRNGTYAQHCHNREVNNNINRKHHPGQQTESISSAAASSNGNFSFNSSFDESVSTCGGFHDKVVVRSFDNVGRKQRNYPGSEVYHSCIDLPHSHVEGIGSSAFSTANLYNSDYQSTQNGSLVNSNSDIGNNTNQPIRSQVKTGHDKMDTTVRSHSLGDLASGLTFSLVGQKKSESVVSIHDNSKLETEKWLRSNRNIESGSATKVGSNNRNIESGSATKVGSNNRNIESVSAAKVGPDSRDIFQGSGLSSEVNMMTNQQTTKNLSSAPVSEIYSYSHHQSKHQSKPEEPHQHKKQHPHQQQLLKQHPIPDVYSQSVSSSRTRKDSEDTTSSYKSAFSEVRSSQDVDIEYHNNNKVVTVKSTNINNNNRSFSYPPNTISTNNTLNSSSNNACIPAKMQPTVTIFQPAGHPTREKSPVKPRRSLPSVPLSETSERIKRFTEMMKSRMSVSSSSSRNCSADSSSSKHTPSRMSSVESACCPSEHSRKSSLETASDSEVFVITNSNQVENSNPNGFTTINEISSQMPVLHPMRSQVDRKIETYPIAKHTGPISASINNAGYHNESRYEAKDAQIRFINRRKSYGDGVVQQEFGQSISHYSLNKANVGDSSLVSREQNRYSSQYYNTFQSGETPLPAGDRSSDSGQTLVTNHSYNGSALDSGYTTNNDGENDSFKNKSYQHPHQNQQQQSKQQAHPAQFQHQTQYKNPIQHQTQNPIQHQTQNPIQHQTQNPIQHQTQNTIQHQTQNPIHQNQHLTQDQIQHQIQHRPEIQSHNQYNDNNQHNSRFDRSHFREQNVQCKTSNKQSNNLANAHRFGSVQNVSSAQAHGYPKDFNLLKNNQLFNGDKFPQVALHNENVSSFLATNHKAQIEPVRNEIQQVSQLLNQLQTQDINRSTNRRSWDYTDDNRSDGIPSSQMKRYGKTDERYRSSEVLPSSRTNSDGTYINNSQIGNSEHRLHFNTKGRAMNSSSQNGHSNKESIKLNSIKESAPMSQSYLSELDSETCLTNRRYSQSSHENIHKSNNATLSSDIVELNGYYPGMVDDHKNTDLYQKSNGIPNQQQLENLRPRPVPVSRANRSMRGHTLPGGVCVNEYDSNFSHVSKPDQDTSLFHLTQKYDLAPLLINLPQDKTLKDMIELSEMSVDISMVGIPVVPSSPRGKMPQIGTPGSAFTPVKNSLDQNKPLTARLKVTSFSYIMDDIHQYTTLGRVLKGDIIVEVNGWFCLGADAVHKIKHVEKCQGAITFTVARLKESEDKRYKGQTATERIKGLESEIARLDDLIQTRDERIRNLTSVTFKQHTGTLSDVNGKIPVEGMVIGGDEYVV